MRLWEADDGSILQQTVADPSRAAPPQLHEKRKIEAESGSGQFPGWGNGNADLRTFVGKHLWSGGTRQRKEKLMVREQKTAMNFLGWMLEREWAREEPAPFVQKTAVEDPDAGLTCGVRRRA